MSMGPLRGNKGGPKYEGHMREPTISWWPGTIPAGGVTDEIVATIDILPSLAKLVGAKVYANRDGSFTDDTDYTADQPVRLTFEFVDDSPFVYCELLKRVPSMNLHRSPMGV